MTPGYEAKREVLKRWYLEIGRSDLKLTQDLVECRRQNSFADIERAIEFLYDEHKATGNIKD